MLYIIFIMHILPIILNLALVRILYTLDYFDFEDTKYYFKISLIPIVNIFLFVISAFMCIIGILSGDKIVRTVLFIKKDRDEENDV